MKPRSPLSLILGALALLATPVAAQTKAKPCLQPEEVDAVLLSLAPKLIEAASTTCKPYLPETAYLNQSSRALAERYRAIGAPLWPVAHKAMLKISGMDKAKLNPLIDADATRAMIESLIPQAIAKIKPKECVAADRFASLLDPLPPQNLAGLFTTILQIVSEDNTEKNVEKNKKNPHWEDDLRICPVAAPAGAAERAQP
ncbi:hypothetical protein [Sphingomonas colocasiae]|uniref:Secreted protein n=1 Tax=Sphingomonas colocasiae TaxID=1848973 RepID=A0ABS7PJE0_9SPHN|nr:hypothetical protein [Sphingomonas colocasiae]MBY8821407.1 hypothetical protein [Sphingomonas colocasiae]